MKARSLAFALAIGALAHCASGDIGDVGQPRIGVRDQRPGASSARSGTVSGIQAPSEPEALFPEDPQAMLKHWIESHPEMRCRAETSTRQIACIDGANVRANGDVRASELYVGRPERAARAGVAIIVDCRKQRAAFVIAHDEKSAEAAPVSDDATRWLAAELCAITNVRPDSRLRME